MDEDNDQIVHHNASEGAPVRLESSVPALNGSAKNLLNGTTSTDLPKGLQTTSKDDGQELTYQSISSQPEGAVPPLQLASGSDDIHTQQNSCSPHRNEINVDEGSVPHQDYHRECGVNGDGDGNDCGDSDSSKHSESSTIEDAASDNVSADSKPIEGVNGTEKPGEIGEIPMATAVNHSTSSEEISESHTSFVNESALDSTDKDRNLEQFSEILLDDSDVSNSDNDQEGGDNTEDPVPERATTKKKKKKKTKRVRFADEITGGSSGKCMY